MKSNSRIRPASFRTLTILQCGHIIALIISISVYLYALYGLRGSVGVVRVHMSKYSLAMAFNLCALKFCKHDRIRSARKTPGEVRPDSICLSMVKDQDAKQAQRYIQHLCNMPAIRNRSARTISARPDRYRNISHKISRTVEIRKTGIKIQKSNIGNICCYGQTQRAFRPHTTLSQTNIVVER